MGNDLKCNRHGWAEPQLCLNIVLNNMVVGCVSHCGMTMAIWAQT